MDGLAEFATFLRSARDRGGKQIVAQVNYTAASAAYYIAAQAHEIVTTPSGMVGAIGTIARHLDQSRALDAEGLTYTIVTSDNAPFKAEGNPFEPLSDDARGEIQRVVNHYGRMFVGDVAKGRGITAAKVAADFGQGRMLLPDEAAQAGMVDGIATLGQTVARLAKAARSRTANGAFRAEDEAALITATEDEVPVEAAAPQQTDPESAEPQEPTPLPIPAGAVTRTPAQRIAAWSGAAPSTRRH